jgi:hypothetical protein
MPSGLASRKSGVTVAKSQQHLETFQAGLRSFINEARLLAQFDHPSLVKVHRFWEANGTAYMVMPFYDGITLRDVLHQRLVAPDESWLKQLLKHLLDALEVIHGENCFHRDIAPDNILILKDGRPLLLDFGAARRVISDMTQNLTVILKPGYAPVEQYAEMNSLRQGAWTDIYALAAVIYFAITGKAPMPAVARVMSDSLEPLSTLPRALGHYSQEFLQAIDKALSVKPEARPQSVAEFRASLGLVSAASAGVVELPDIVESATKAAAASGAEKPTAPSDSSRLGSSGLAKYAIFAGVLVVLLSGAWFFVREEPRTAAEGPAPSHAASASASASAPAPAPAISSLPRGQEKVTVAGTPESTSKESDRSGIEASTIQEPSEPERESMAKRGLPPAPAPGPVRSTGPTEPETHKPGRSRVAKANGQAEELGGLAEGHSVREVEPSVSAIQKVIQANLIEGRECMNSKNFECAIAKGETVLQLEPHNPAAEELLKDARVAQQKAWEASELK